jgi:hypothetical protein
MAALFLFLNSLNQIGGIKMNREMLEKPFDPNQIKQREGNFGKTLDYIEGHSVIHRLNLSFESAWSFEILEHKVLNDTDEVIVLGKLSAGDVVKVQFGSSRVTRARESGEMISLADDLKAAATDSLKKAATLLGVGLHLYNNGGNSAGKQQNSTNHSTGSNANSNHGRNNSHQGDNGGNGRISAKQHKYILGLTKELGWTKSELNQKCLQAYGVGLDFLNRSDASNLINELLNQ